MRFLAPWWHLIRRLLLSVVSYRWRHWLGFTSHHSGDKRYKDTKEREETMGLSLYEIDKAVVTVLDDGLVFNEETGEIVFDVENLDALETERNTKLEGVALYIKSLEAEADAMKAEEKALAERRAVREKKAERLRRYLSDSMQALGDTKLETARVALSFRKSESVVIEDQAALPVEFLKVKMTETPDKTAIKKAIKAGATVEGAALVENKNLQIK